MEDQNKFELTQKLLESATSIIVVIPPDPSQDIISRILEKNLKLVVVVKFTSIQKSVELRKFLTPLETKT